MAEVKPCPLCGALAEKVFYTTRPPGEGPVGDLSVWECTNRDCGWMEDADE